MVFIKNRFPGFFLCVTAILLLSASVCQVQAKPAGMFNYKAGELIDLDKDTVLVSDTMVAMTGKFYAHSLFFIDTIRDTPAIFFVIDNSGSMGGSAAESLATDKTGKRFTVTSSFLDTIKAQFPGADVGVAVFGSTLWFDPNDRPYFSTCAAQSQGAYVPLLKLNMTYAEFGNKSGYQILKEILDTALYISSTSPQYPYAGLRYMPSSTALRGTSTNINAGFDAVRCAMAKSSRPKENQYVVFISDGEATVGNQPNAFASGINIPTTFTFYFTSSDAVPATISTMTNNIRQNAYSTSNPKSACWPLVNTFYDSLLSYMQDTLFTMILTVHQEQPFSLSLGSFTPISWLDSTFFFSSPLPLTGTKTAFNFSISYKIIYGSVIVRDTVRNGNFVVKIQPGIELPADLFDCTYWDRDLRFRYNNADIQAALEPMDSIALRFDYNSGTANYNYTSVTVELLNTQTPIDKETLVLVNRTGFFSKMFARAVSGSPVQGNGVLEHRMENDSIVAVFWNRENPVLPLDTLRIAIPFSTSGTISKAAMHDRTIRCSVRRLSSVIAVKIDLPSTARSVDAVLFNATGKAVASAAERGSQTAVLMLPEKARGIYLLKVISGKESVVRKLLVP